MLVKIYAQVERANDGSIIQVSDLVGILTVILLFVSGVILPVTYWYIANRPNVIARAKWEDGIAALIISNDGRTSARSVDIRCPSGNLPRYQTKGEVLHFHYALLHPGQHIEYFISGVNDAIEKGPYHFVIRYRRWFARGMLLPHLKYVKRTFDIDFDSYRHALIRGELSTQLNQQLENLARSVDAVLTTLVDKHDLWRHRRHLCKTVARRTYERLKRIGARSQ